MTKGSEVHDDLSRHVKTCETCRPLVAKPGVPFPGCQLGRELFRAWERWCKEGD